jgi:3'-phosphoadenosine 5'-phosphosulfate sulfotransferase (PAPS reductase)/FAD synthetase
MLVNPIENWESEEVRKLFNYSENNLKGYNRLIN